MGVNVDSGEGNTDCKVACSDLSMDLQCMVRCKPMEDVQDQSETQTLERRMGNFCRTMSSSP